MPQASTGTQGNDFPILQYSSLQSLSNYHNVHGIGNRGHRSGSVTIEAIIEETDDNSFILKTTTADEKTVQTFGRSKTVKIGRREIVEHKTKTPASARRQMSKEKNLANTFRTKTLRQGNDDGLSKKEREEKVR